MPLYVYEAQDQYGKPASGVLDSPNPAALRDQLAATGFRLTSVRPYVPGGTMDDAPTLRTGQMNVAQGQAAGATAVAAAPAAVNFDMAAGAGPQPDVSAGLSETPYRVGAPYPEAVPFPGAAPYPGQPAYPTAAASAAAPPGGAGPSAPMSQTVVNASPQQAPAGAKRLSVRAQSLLFREFAATFRAGMTAFQACDAMVGRYSSGAMSRLVQWVKERAAAGGGFADALATAPVAVDPPTVGIIRAGERGGFLPFVLDELAASFERQYHVASRVMTAKILYIWVLIPLLLVVWPIIGFAAATSQGAVNGTVMNAAQSLAVGGRSYVTAFLHQSLPAGIIIILIALVWKQWTNTLPGRRFADAVGLKVPVWGKMQKSLCLSRFTRILAHLYRGGVPLREAWILSADAVPNYTIMGILRAQDGIVASNQPISAALRATGLFDAGSVGMIQTGEQTGEVDAMLFRLAIYEEENMDRAGRVLPIIARVAFPIMAAPFVIIVMYKIFTAIYNPFLNM